MALTAGKAEALMEKIEENQSWSPDNIQACHQSEEAPEELYALSTKMDVTPQLVQFSKIVKYDYYVPIVDIPI